VPAPRFKDLTLTKQADSGAGTLSVSMPTVVEEDDMLVAAISCGMLMSPPTGWTYGGGAVGTVGRGLAIYYKVAGGDEGGTTVAFDRRVGGAANAPVVHAVGRYSEFTFDDTGVSTSGEDRAAASEHAAWGAVMRGGEPGMLVFVANKYAVTANTSGSNIHGTPLATARGFDTQANGASNDFCSLIWADLTYVLGDFDPGALVPYDEGAAPWAYLQDVGSNYSIIPVTLAFNSPVAVRGESRVFARPLKVPGCSLPYQLSTGVVRDAST